jgi:heme-degrading monooxygenase HmoA
MYGTVAKVRLKPGTDPDEILKIEDEFAARKVRGYIAEYVYQTDADPQVYYIVALFESEEAYRANADDPAQHQEYLKLRALLESDPEWNDGKVIYPVR